MRQPAHPALIERTAVALIRLFWLFALPPSVAATLVVVVSVASQLQSLPTVWRSIEFKRLAPFALPGLAAVPIGTLLLSEVDVQAFKTAVGGVLLAYMLMSLLARTTKPVAWGGRLGDGVIGAAGGVLGGLAGLSGPLPTMWANLRGWTKDEKRSVIQGFNLTILLVALVAHLVGGFFTAQLLLSAAVALPVAAAGTWLGVRCYGRVNGRQFTRLLLILLGASGLSLAWTGLA
ncbi:MAG: sulfite exporter TauE/SafE family protein [Pseudomonadota bacterium]